MHTDITGSLPKGLYRPGSGFSAAELHVMVHEGAVRPLLGDLYACTSLTDAPALRALACRALLTGALRTHAVLCGESAAWVHLGTGTVPSRITVITAGVYRRRTAGRIPWQVHQVPLQPAEQLELHGTPVTTPLRTAADLFLGIGTVQSRRSLEASRTGPRFHASPHVSTGPDASSGPDPGGLHDGDEERWAAIRGLGLTHPEQIQLASLLRQILKQVSGPLGAKNAGTAVSRGRQDRIEALLAARAFGP